MTTQIQSIWTATTPKTEYPRLEGERNVDVAIVGGGITGLTAAILLKKQGKKVCVVDMASVAGGESGFTTAHLTEILDIRYRELIHQFGKESAQSAVAAHRAAIDQIETFILENQISCAFKRHSAYLFTEKPSEESMIGHEVIAADSLGVNAVACLDIPLISSATAAMCVGNQAQFHPREYLLALARLIPGDGCEIFESSQVHHIEDGEPCRVETEHGKIIARDVIVATNANISSFIYFHTMAAPYRTYALAARLKSQEPIPALFYDTEDPYHYIRGQSVAPTKEYPGGEYIIVGGEDHKTGTKRDTEECFRQLESYTRNRFAIEDDIPFRWSGQILEPVDGLAYIGRNPLSKHVWGATGFSGNGMTYGTLAAMILSDAILGHANKWAGIYDSTRFKPMASISEFIAENKDFPVYFIGDRLAKADLESVDEVKPGEGKIVQMQHEKYAAYRDDHGDLHVVSALCTHMGCLVHWNNAEKTWDCPCHGSRFDPDGHVLNGPAVTNLKPATLPHFHVAGD